jgi:hypothetical protein
MDQRPGGEPPPYNDPEGRRHYASPNIDIDYERQRAAATRDYTTPAVITLILYFVCWLPGVIANVIYYLQAQRDEALTGRSPQGKGCLLWLLIVMNAFIIIGVLFYCVLLFFGAAASAG